MIKAGKLELESQANTTVEVLWSFLAFAVMGIVGQVMAAIVNLA